MIELKNLKLIFSKNTPLEKLVLNNLCLKINAGEFITIIGGNGAGKSSLLNIICGQLKANQGDVLIDGKNLKDLALVKMSQIITKVFQDPQKGTFNDLTVEENLALAKYKYCKNKFSFALDEKFKDSIQKKLADLPIGLAFRLKDKVGLLSGGQRQVLSLLMATLYPGKILLLDEITAALDPEITEKVLTFTKNLIKENGLTALMVTHSMNCALKYGTRTLVLQKGRIAKDIDFAQKQNMQVSDLLQFFD